MSVNEEILDKITGDAVNIQRYEASVQREIIRDLKSLEKQLVTELRNSNAVDAVRQQTRQKRLKALIAKTRVTISDAYTKLSKEQITILREVAELSELQTVSAINTSIKADVIKPSLSTTTLNSIASDTLIEGSPTKQWWARKSTQFQDKFEDTVRMGMMQGQTTDQIVRSLVGTQANRFKDGALISQYRGAEAIVRSSIQTVANTARLDTYQNNSDIIKGIEWSATFDNMTSQICMSLDGLQWDMDYKPIGHSKAFVGSTAHWNCRSTQVPITKSWEELGAKGKFSEIPESTRASMDGQVSGGKNYEGWLKTKSKAFQIEVLGVEKQKLWKAGKLSFSDLVNQRSNPLTLTELQNKIKPKPKIVKRPVPKPAPKPKTTAMVQDALTVQLTKNATDSRYLNSTVYRQPKEAVGTANLKGLTNEASVMFQGFLDEADTVVRKFNVQGIRRITNTGRRKSIAMMGDGNFYFNKKYFNNYAKTFSASEIKELEKFKVAQQKRKDILKPKLDKAKEEYMDARRAYLDVLDQKGKVSTGLTNEVTRLNEKANKLIREYNDILNENKKLADYDFWVERNIVSKWKVGDNLSERPWSVSAYTKGADQSMRSTVFHEFGHQIHQQFGVTNVSELRSPPLEKALNLLFRRKGIVKPSKYSDTNSKEWFAENFALYARGKKDLVDPTLKDLLTQMEKGVVKDADTLNDWYVASKKLRFD